MSVAPTLTRIKPMNPIIIHTAKVPGLNFDSLSPSEGERDGVRGPRYMERSRRIQPADCLAVAGSAGSLPAAAHRSAGVFAGELGQRPAASSKTILPSQKSPVPGRATVPVAVFGVSPKTSPAQGNDPSQPSVDTPRKTTPDRRVRARGLQDFQENRSSCRPGALTGRLRAALPARSVLLTLCLLLLATLFPTLVPAAEAPLVGPNFAVFVLYQLGSTNLCKYAFGEFTNECLPIERVYLNETYDLTASYTTLYTQDCTPIGEGTLSTTSTHAFSQHDYWCPIAATYVALDPFPCDGYTYTNYTVSFNDVACSGYSTVIDNGVVQCSTTRDTDSCGIDYNYCWSGQLGNGFGPAATSTGTITPKVYTELGVYNVNDAISYLYNEAGTMIECTFHNTANLTNKSVATLDTEYKTTDLIGNTINFDDPTWYSYGFAYGGIDPSERCALLLGMNYQFWFIAPAGKPFNFQYDERFIPDDTSVPSSIIKIGTVSGVGTGQWQSWGPAQSLPHFYTVSSGGCTFTRGGTTIVEIPAGNGGGLGNGNGDGNGDGNGFGDGNGGDDGGGNIGCTTCSCSSTPGGVTANAEGVNVKVNLGGGQYGQAQGSLVVTETNSSTALFTPATLHYLGGFTNNINVIPDGSGNVRQVKAPQSFADIITNNSTSYEIRLYTALPTTMSGGFYVPIGSPFKVVRIEKLSAINQLQLTEIDNLNSATNIYEYVWNSTTHGWALTSGGGFRQDVVAWSSSGLMKTNSILNSGGTAVYRAVTYFEALTNGLVQTQKVVDPGGAALTSKWFYYDNTSTDGTNYGKLRLSISSSGFWQSYQYDTNGLITNLTSQFLNAATNASPTNCRVVSYSYANINSSLYAQTVVEALLGQEISRTYYLTYPSRELIIRCQTPGAAWNAANNLVTTNLYVATGEFAGKIQSIGNPDGTMTIYGYTDGGYYLNTRASTGQPNSTGTAIIDGTQTDTAVDSYGALWVQTSTDIKSTIQTQNDVYSTTDPLDRPEQVVYQDYTTTSTSYACCGPDTSTARDGTVSYYYYDAIKRQTASMINSIITTNVLDPAGRVLAAIRIGSSGGQITNVQAVYDLAGRVMFQTNALNGVIQTTNTFDGSGQTIVTNTNPDAGTIIWTYAQDSSLLSVAGTAAHQTSYLYGVDSNGVFTTTVKWSATGGTNEWVKTYTDMLGRSYLTVYAGATTNPSAISYYNSAGQLSKEVDPDGIITLYGYSAKGGQVYTAQDMNQNGVIDFSGTDRITFTTNDVFADSVLSVNVQRSRTYVFATNGTPSSNLVSTVETLVSGLQSWQILWNGGVGITNHSLTAYDGAGITTETDTAPDGSYRVGVTQYGQMISETSYDSTPAQLAQTTYGYDQYGRQNTVTDARSGTTTFTFDNAGNVKSTTTPPPGTGLSGQVTTSFFDKMHRMTGTTLPDGTSVTNLYLLTGQIKQTSGSRIYPVGYGYDAQGRITTMTNWANFAAGLGSRVTSWNYDAYRGFVTNKVYAGGVAGPSYAYTAAGRLFTRLWARGIYTTNAYDALGESSGTTYSDGTTPSVLFGFDRRGRKTSITNGATVTTLTYNDQNEKLTESYSGGPLDGISVTNAYDSLLRRTNLVARNSGLLNSTSYRFDTASRMASVSDGTNSATYSYLANSPFVSQIVFTSGTSLRMTTTKNYDYLNRLTSISSANASSVILDSRGYAYNSANQRTSVTNADGTYWVYKYDSFGQMTSGIKYWSDGSAVAGQQFGYSFDNIGNRQSSLAGGDQWGDNVRYENYSADSLNQYTSRTVPGAVDIIGVATNAATVTVNNRATYRKGTYYRAQLPVNNASGPIAQSLTNLAVLHEGTNSDILTNINGNVLVPPANQMFTYDADGNTTNDSAWTYIWDGQNQLTEMRSVSSLATDAQKKLDFAYDYVGRRIQKTVSTNSGSGWSAIGTTIYVYDGWNLIAELNGTSRVLMRSYQWGLDVSGSIQGAGGIGGLAVANLGGNGFIFPTFDGSGNISSLVGTTTASVSGQYEYGPFGESIRITGNAASVNPLRFSTKYADSESDLLYYGYRYCNVSTGRWLSRDPLGAAGGGQNLFGFVLNNPVVLVDSIGLAHGKFTVALKQAVMDTDRKTGNLVTRDWGFEVTYDPNGGGPCPCHTGGTFKHIIYVAQAVNDNWIDHAHIDAALKLVDLNRSTHGGIPIPPFVAGRKEPEDNADYYNNPLHVIDAPVIGSENDNHLWEMEDCALCSLPIDADHKGSGGYYVLGCVRFTFARPQSIGVTMAPALTITSAGGGLVAKGTPKTVNADEPGELWNKSVEKWRNEAGK